MSITPAPHLDGRTTDNDEALRTLLVQNVKEVPPAPIHRHARELLTARVVA